MFRFSVLAVVLAIGANGLFADDKKETKNDAKKDSAGVKGKVVSFDRDKKCLKLKTADGEKDYATGDEVVIVMQKGPRFNISLKKEAAPKGPQDATRARNTAILGYVLKTGNEVEVVLSDKDNQVKEVHFNPQAGPPVGKPAGAPGKPTGAPASLKTAAPASTPAVKTDAQK